MACWNIPIYFDDFLIKNPFSSGISQPSLMTLVGIKKPAVEVPALGVVDVTTFGTPWGLPTSTYHRYRLHLQYIHFFVQVIPSKLLVQHLDMKLPACFGTFGQAGVSLWFLSTRVHICWAFLSLWAFLYGFYMVFSTSGSLCSSCELGNKSPWGTHLAIRHGDEKVTIDRRKFRSQTSDNMDRWKAEQGRGREKGKD